MLSYAVIFWVHPHTEALFARIAPWLSYVLCGAAIGVLISDATLTIRQLAVISKLTRNLARISDELQLQLSLGKSELEDKLDEKTAALRARYSEQIRSWEENSRRFRNNYHLKLNQNYHISLDDLRAASELAREEIQRAKTRRKDAKKAK